MRVNMADFVWRHSGSAQTASHHVGQRHVAMRHAARIGYV